VRLSPQQRLDNEAKIRAVMSRLLNGDIPAGGKADVKTLAREAGIDRAAFYGSRPYTRLREEFDQRLRELDQAGEQPDPRDAQVTRLKDEIARLKERLAQSAATVTELTDFRGQALARLAAQHDEITRLRHDLQRAATIRRLPGPAGTPPVKEPALP
jgi:transposase-like protein